MENARRFTAQTVFEVALLAAGAAISAVSWGYGFGTLARPGPGLYPFFVGAAIALFAVAILLSRWRRAPPASHPLAREAVIRLALMSGIFVFWIVAMPALGYAVVTLAAACALAKVMGLEGWVKPLAVGAGTAFFVYVLFDHWLYIDLPRGILG